MGEGVLLEPNVWLTAPGDARIRIGAGSFLNIAVMVAAVELVEIGEHCMFANGCFVSDGNHRFDDPDKPVPWQGFSTKGPTRIGDNVWCGANVVVSSGVTIGERCVIGANSVVTQDVPPFSIAAGAPGAGDQAGGVRGGRGTVGGRLPGPRAQQLTIRWKGGRRSAFPFGPRCAPPTPFALVLSRRW